MKQMCFNRSIRGYVSIRYMVRSMIYCCFSFSHAQNKKFSSESANSPVIDVRCQYRRPSALRPSPTAWFQKTFAHTVKTTGTQRLCRIPVLLFSASPDGCHHRNLCIAFLRTSIIARSSSVVGSYQTAEASSASPRCNSL